MSSSALFLYFGWTSTGMPRPLSVTSISFPSAKSVTSRRVA